MRRGIYICNIDDNTIDEDDTKLLVPLGEVATFSLNGEILAVSTPNKIAIYKD